MAVEMMALLTLLWSAMKGSADDAADKEGLASFADNHIAGMAVRFALEILFATLSPEVSIEMEDVPVAIRDESESGI